MIWRIGTQFLVQRDDAFEVVDATGSVARRFLPEVTSHEDERYRTHYRIVDRQLRRQIAIERRGEAPRVAFEVVFPDLVADTSAETARFVATAFGDDAVIQEEERLRVLHEAEARVAAIDGSLADLARGPHVARAQAALRRRVHQWNDEVARALLVTLITLARAHTDVPAHALAAFANGCLFACFEREVPDLPDGPLAAHPTLAARCAAHARALERAAEEQAWVDAHANASAYERAAIAVAIAAELLGHSATTGS